MKLGSSSSRVFFGLGFTAIFTLFTAPATATVTTVTTNYEIFRGPCDASAVVPVSIDGKQLFVVADDEKNQLTTYQLGQPSPVSVLKLDSGEGDGELDLEGGAMFHGYQLWMGSHSRDSHGESSPSRDSFFATKIDHGQLNQVGYNYGNIARDMMTSDVLADLPIFVNEKDEDDGSKDFNIEAIASDEHQMLIGLRGPLVDNKAVVIFVANPLDVVLRNISARITGYDLLDLGGLGVRDLVYDAESGSFLIVAGSVSKGHDYALYQWHPGGETRKLADLPEDTTPEAILLGQNNHEYSHTGSQGGDLTRTARIFSDDGSFKNDEKSNRCNKWPDSQQRFRTFNIEFNSF